MSRTSRRVAIFATDYGREAGWDVFVKGTLVCSLEDSRQNEQFWHSYVVSPADPSFFCHQFWESGVEVVSRLTGEKAVSSWFVNFDRVEGRLLVRALYLDPGFPEWPTFWERRLVSRWRARNRRPTHPFRG